MIRITVSFGRRRWPSPETDAHIVRRQEVPTRAAGHKAGCTGEIVVFHNHHSTCLCGERQSAM